MTIDKFNKLKSSLFMVVGLIILILPYSLNSYCDQIILIAEFTVN
ncbi:hypothetical protein LPE509_00709 [Legionella pneumophila subsp. pneumophila LPE509]|nr:hypothetical protein LPE509_00709 [Legionella pneumophila subsp. pneumophila LPE509]